MSAISRLVAILSHLSKIMSEYSDDIDENYKTNSLLMSSVYNLMSNAYFFGLDKEMLKAIYLKARLGEIKWKI